jgi:glucans biosynthesis protein C
LTQGFKGNYLDFYPTVFTTGVYPKGNLSWHHLWFILYLFLYDIVFARFFKWSTSEQGQQKMAFFNKLANRKWIYLLMLPSLALYTSLTLSFPETHDLIHDWCRIFYWLLFLLAGFICINFPALLDSLERNRRTSLLLLFIAMLAINYIRWNDLEPDEILPNWRHDWRTYAFITLFPLAAWASIFTAIGYAKRYLNKKLPILNYLNEAVYPFYILHQTIIVIIAYYVVQCTEAVAVKFIFTFVIAFVVTVCIYHLFIRPYAVTRFLFGMKPRGKGTGDKIQGASNKAQESGAQIQEAVILVV